MWGETARLTSAPSTAVSAWSFPSGGGKPQSPIDTLLHSRYVLVENDYHS
ncbi:hypothetical protein GDI1337 [Gluconacetobacter diazotrophicus PA1 5]|uniref:Uncharacterized protein n=1 Tax=Gluconacetobacter diazotrophicus (strain ATCC 49037 / DSM 5601 / CCUG 37298 / CIP 103539 / LMG 7603 / PAl5) TaxID=272568 RepID=A9HEU3_GLUDA|nr:hypothetical protein GDI1337 [Gluconacetobacter diazotrophicus PA1 5]